VKLSPQSAREFSGAAKMSFHLILAAVALTLLAGCNQQAPVGAPLNAPATAPAVVSSQLEAALAIMNPLMRDDALGSVAKAAAAASDSGIAMAAVVAMANPILKDDAAVVCAQRLAKGGKGPEATAMAKIIQNPIKRDEILLELSKR